jgi:hypothetical protein
MRRLYNRDIAEWSNASYAPIPLLLLLQLSDA